jgi:hypothetical protein
MLMAHYDEGSLWMPSMMLAEKNSHKGRFSLLFMTDTGEYS